MPIGDQLNKQVVCDVVPLRLMQPPLVPGGSRYQPPSFIATWPVLVGHPLDVDGTLDCAHLTKSCEKAVPRMPHRQTRVT